MFADLGCRALGFRDDAPDNEESNEHELTGKLG